MGTSGRNIKPRPTIDESVWPAETTGQDAVLAEFADETALTHVGSPKVVELASYRARLSEWRLLNPRTPLLDVARMIFVGCLSAMALGGSFAIGFGYIWSDRSIVSSATDALNAVTARPYPDGWWPPSLRPPVAPREPKIATNVQPQGARPAKSPNTGSANGSNARLTKPPSASESTSAQAPSAAVPAEAETTTSASAAMAEPTAVSDDESVLPSEAMVLHESAPASPAPSSLLTVVPEPAVPRATRDIATARSETNASLPVVRRGDTDAVRQVISQYERAYSQKDLGAMAVVWPSLDTDGVARAFAEIDHQALTLKECRVATSGSLATAVCPGHVSYVGRVGGRRVQEREGTWTIALERRGDTWHFVRLSVR